jgi:hypothetical protein
MYSQNDQELGGLVPHICDQCRDITIDGTQTGTRVERRFSYTYSEVQARALGCGLFGWALQLPYWDLNPQASLVLSISSDTEDLEFLDAQWHGCHNFTEMDGTAQPSLFIFAEEGSLRKIECIRI